MAPTMVCISWAVMFRLRNERTRPIVLRARRANTSHPVGARAGVTACCAASGAMTLTTKSRELESSASSRPRRSESQRFSDKRGTVHLDEDIAADMYRTVRAGYTDSTAYLCINRKDKSKLHGTECLSLSSRTRRHEDTTTRRNAPRGGSRGFQEASMSQRELKRGEERNRVE